MAYAIVAIASLLVASCSDTDPKPTTVIEPTATLVIPSPTPTVRSYPGNVEDFTRMEPIDSLKDVLPPTPLPVEELSSSQWTLAGLGEVITIPDRLENPTELSDEEIINIWTDVLSGSRLITHGIWGLDIALCADGTGIGHLFDSSDSIFEWHLEIARTAAAKTHNGVWIRMSGHKQVDPDAYIENLPENHEIRIEDDNFRMFWSADNASITRLDDCPVPE